MKHILEIGIYRSGHLASEVIDLTDVNARVSGKQAVFTGHAMVRSRFKGQDFSGFYQLTKVYEKQQGRWRVIASKTARIGDKMKQAVSSYLEDNSKMAKSDGDDLGLPESPIYSNFSKNLWTTHARHGSVQSPNRSPENTDGPRPPQDEPLPVIDKPNLVDEEENKGKVAA
jgi:hypothetical protein